METVHLVPGDTALAKRMFSVMAAVFGEPIAELSDDYVAKLLADTHFWAIAAMEGDQVVGGVTAHTLRMTRTQSSEIFIYDLAVRSDRQRQGIGRSLIRHLREAGAAQGIDTVFVAADNEDEHAVDFYRALHGVASPVTVFAFEGTPGPR
jgi:aminoglycoside 3-N-acetyltransferase I